MTRPDTQPVFDARARLARKKSIDATCDRFEEAWSAGKQPRIEAYLSDAAEAGRAELFRELLACELALRGPRDPSLTRAVYLQRFPDYRECVLAAFANMSTQHPAGDSCEGEDARGRLIETMRQRLREKERQVAGSLEGDKPPSPRPENSEPQSEQLWDQLVRRAAISNLGQAASSAAVENVERLAEVILKLLDAFPNLRRGILVSLLLGETIDQAAQRHRCTERTVSATRQTAMELLGRPLIE